MKRRNNSRGNSKRKRGEQTTNRGSAFAETSNKKLYTDKFQPVSYVVYNQREEGYSKRKRDKGIKPTYRLTLHPKTEHNLSHTCISSNFYSHVCFANRDGRISVWKTGKLSNGNELNGEKPVYEVRHLDSFVTACCFISDDVVVTGGDDKSIKIFDLVNKAEQNMELHKDFISVLFPLKNRTMENGWKCFLSGSFDKTVAYWATAASKEPKWINTLKSYVDCVAEIDRDRVVIGLGNLSLVILELFSGKVEKMTESVHGNRISSVVYHEGFIISCSWDGTLVWHDVDFAFHKKISVVDFANSLVVLEGGLFAVVANTNFVYLYDENGCNETVLEGSCRMDVVHRTVDGKLIAGCQDGSFVIWGTKDIVFHDKLLKCNKLFDVIFQ